MPFSNNPKAAVALSYHIHPAEYPSQPTKLPRLSLNVQARFSRSLLPYSPTTQPTAMAPSTRRVAPSSSVPASTIRVSKRQSRQNQTAQALNLLFVEKEGFGRVTKSTTRASLNLRKFSEVEKTAFEAFRRDEDDALTRNDENHVSAAVALSSGAVVSKRKLDDLSEDENDGGLSERVNGINLVQSKKRRVWDCNQLLTPPASRDGTDCDEFPSLKNRAVLNPRIRRVNAALPALVELPQFLADIISMHAAFLKALSLYYAHNGPSSPAELGLLMDSVTRLWKKQNVCKIDIQRMLGLYEIGANSTLAGMKQVDQKSSPFTMIASGLGLNVRTNLEYIGQSQFSEKMLQATFSDMVHNIFKTQPNVNEIQSIPLLTIGLGFQTSLHRSKAASTRAEILNLSNSAQPRATPDFSKLSITDPSDHTPAAVKSRTLSLFDRVRAKGLANANNTAPTAEQITRQHAVGRTSEVVEFLRMKQQQKLSTQFHSSVHDSPGSLRGLGKVSFSLGAIVRDIQQSVGVPISNEEVKVCLKLLSQELPGDWCRMHEFGSVVSITLQGDGVSGIEAKKILQAKILRS